ncbi:MAG: GNAT family N-acetyltransferase [Eubacteriales bacterium]
MKKILLMKKLVNKIVMELIIKKSNKIDNVKIKEFYKAYNSSIYLDDDKDTFEDFSKIINSGDEDCEFYIAYLEKDNNMISGALIMSIKNNPSEINIFAKICVIIYVFTVPDYRKKGSAKYILEQIFEKFKNSIWFCEVLDEEKLTLEQSANEKKYSGISCNERNIFWNNMGFYKCEFDYYNPIPNIKLNCNGVITYNKLLAKTDTQFINKNLLLRFIYLYFKYGYCAGETDNHKWEAYDLNKNQLHKVIYLNT